MGQPLPRILGRQKPVAHPTPRGTIPADVAEATLVVAIRRTEADLLDGLIHDQTLGVVLDDSQTIAANVQLGPDGTTTGVLKTEEGT